MKYYEQAVDMDTAAVDTDTAAVDMADMAVMVVLPQSKSSRSSMADQVSS